MKVVKEWKKVKVDLALLADFVESFFKSKEFEVSRIKTERGYNLIVRSKTERGRLITNIYKTSEGVAVSLGTRESTGIRILAPVLTLFGGGSLFIREIESEELLQKLEQEFWKYIEEIMSSLSKLN